MNLNFFKKHKVILLILIGMLFLNSVNAQLADSSWPTFHGNLQRTGLSPYDTSHVDGTIKWSFETRDGIESSPAIGPDGTIYVGSHDGYLYAVNKNGEEKWRLKLVEAILDQGYDVKLATKSSPSIASDGTIYIASRANYLHAVSPSGKEKWRFPIDVAFDSWSSPAIGEDGTIYILSSDAGKHPSGLYALNPDGTKKWHFDTGGGFASPAIGKDGIIYIGVPSSAVQNTVIAIKRDGTKKWQLSEGKRYFFESSPAVSQDGTIYFGTLGEGGKGGLYALDKNGKKKWHFDTKGREAMSTPAIGKDGTIYFGSDDGNLYAINPDGTERWHFATTGLVESSAAISADGTIYFSVSSVEKDQPVFYALNPDGTEKWHSITWAGSAVSSPAIGEDGTVYVGSWDGKLYAFGGSGVDESQEEEVRAAPEKGEVGPEKVMPLGKKEEEVSEEITPPAQGIPPIYVVGAVVLGVVIGILIGMKKRGKGV